MDVTHRAYHKPKVYLVYIIGKTNTSCNLWVTYTWYIVTSIYFSRLYDECTCVSNRLRVFT